ncbi:MAG: CYTH domain-containing protein [Lachnospiraceae bacterium]|nr:CYTH domain-containing protein [Lachnospiraceae bacterium]
MEIERKYTIRQLPPDLEQYETREIEQAYLCMDPVVRVRRSNENYILTYKSKADPDAAMCVNEEIEARLTRESYLHLRAKSDANPVTKTRYLIPLQDGLVAELDVFHGRLQGLVFCEVEFPSVEAAESFTAPEWFDRDVSTDRRYSNAFLATLSSPEEAGL